jgi:hypothetical protein
MTIIVQMMFNSLAYSYYVCRSEDYNIVIKILWLEYDWIKNNANNVFVFCDTRWTAIRIACRN